jgi:hypothetical protein
VLLERSWWAGFYGIYLVRFGSRTWEILIFKWFLPLKIQINSKKPGFGRRNQLRTWYNTWAWGHTSMYGIPKGPWKWGGSNILGHQNLGWELGVETRIFYIPGPHKIKYWLWPGK